MPAALVFVLATLVVLGGCAPLPVAFYTGDASQGRLLYGNCSLGGVPEGLLLARSGIEILVDNRGQDDSAVVHLRYDVAHGHRVRLASREIAVDPRDGSGPRIGAIDAIDVSDRADPDGWKDNRVRRAGLRPPEILMDDAQLPPLSTGPRPYMSIRHYWAAARIPTGHAHTLWLQLPELTVDGASVVFTPIRFDRHLRVAPAPLNC
jgi:hypothetical protein